MQKNNLIKILNVEIKEVNNLKLDKMYIANEDVRKHIFAYLNNQVIHVTYYGKGKIEDIIPLLSKKMHFYQD